MTTLAIENNSVTVREPDGEARAAVRKPRGKATPARAAAKAVDAQTLVDLGYGDALALINEAGGFATTKEGARALCRQMALKSQARQRK